MTLKGQKNHYNVKLLRGYGVAISLKDNKISLRDGTDLFGHSEKEEWFVTRLPYEKIVISGKGYVSIEALSLLNQHNTNVILADTFGNPVSLMTGVMESMTGTRYRMAQYDAFRDTQKRLYLQKQFVKLKLESQINFLKSTCNPLVEDGISRLEWHLGKISEASDPVRIEAPSSHVYFRNYAKLIPEKYGFTARNNSSLRSTKRNATDVINGLLNYGYAVLAGEISKFVCGFGLDPYFGFNHSSHTGFMPLVYDIMEPFRWLVEHSVYKLANHQNHEKSIKVRDYAFTRNGSVVLDSVLVKRFLELLERTFQSEREYHFKHGKKNENGMSMCQEITIAKITIQNLIDFCVDKMDGYMV